MNRFVAWLESWFVCQRETANCLVVALSALPMVFMPWGMQCIALFAEDSQTVYRAEYLFVATLLLTFCMIALVVFAFFCWRRRLDERSNPRRVSLFIALLLVMLTLLGIAYGYKDTPLALFWLGMLMLARALLGATSIRWGFWCSLFLVVTNEGAMATDRLIYAPLLSAPVFSGEALSSWWSIWLRVLYDLAAIPLCGMFFILFDIFNKEKLQLEALVCTDALTGLANRREFMTQLEAQCRRHVRSKRPLCVMICDVDHFKQVNDTWGHPAGDEVLAYLGKILRESTRQLIDMPARYGGEEFVVLFPETDLEQAKLVAETIHGQLRTHEFVQQGQRFQVTQSVGIAQVNDGDGDLGLRVADANLYRAKNGGRNCIVASVAQVDNGFASPA